MTVYADILFIVNMYVDAILLYGTARFLHLPLKKGRWLLASLLGGALGLCALLPPMPGGLLLLLCLVQTLLLVAAAFGRCGLRILLKGAFLLFLLGAALSGVLAAMRRFLPVHGVVLRNGAVYFDISPLLLVLLTCGAYGVLYLFERIFRKRQPDVLYKTAWLTLGGKSVTLRVKVDTGLTLREPFSGQPVLVAERSALAAVLPADFGTESCTLPLRLVPFSTIGGSGILPAFRPDSLFLEGEALPHWAAVSARPLSAGGVQALIGTDLPAANLHERTGTGI